MSPTILAFLLPPFACAAGVPVAQEPAAEPAPLHRTIDDLGGGIQVVAKGPRVGWTDEGLLRIGSGDDAELRDPLSFEAVEAQGEAEAESDGESAGDPPAPRADAWRLDRVTGRRGSYEVQVEKGSDRETLFFSEKPILTHTTGLGGRFLSFAANGDLYYSDLDEQRPKVTRVTHDGDPDTLDGVLDWVYQEELYGRGDFQAHWWSPVAPKVAFLTLLEHRVRSFQIVDFVPDEPLDIDRGVELETMRYPKAGDPNPLVSLSIHDVESGKTRPVQLPGMPRDGLIVRVAWTPDGTRLLVTVKDRIQTWAKLLAVDPVSGDAELWIQESSPTWVNRPSDPIWLENGDFLWLTERTGYQHLAHYEREADGVRLVGSVTFGDWQVRRVLHVDEENGFVEFEGTAGGAIDRNVYRVPLARLDRGEGYRPVESGQMGDRLTRLTTGPGSHGITWNPARTLFLDRVSSVSEPPRTLLCDADGQVLRVVSEDTIDPDVPYAAWELLEIPARDGYPLDASVLRPLDRAADGPVPVLVDIYSGPDAPTVRNAWRVSDWRQFLAQEGVQVLRVNVRSASGRGQAHTGFCYKQLGVRELEDLEDAVDYAVANLGADPARVGITGWSYGGFMSAYALTHSDKFALGLAGAGVHDWRLYDTIYTERYMSTPQLNPEGYASTSVLAAAGELRGHLAILHGTIDDNVHLQNSIRLVDALQRAGQDDFSFMVYPGWRHGVGSPHRTRFNWAAIEEHLLDR